MKTVEIINFSGKRAIVRVDFNVPLNAQFQVTDLTRITSAVPTINKILTDGGSVVLISHLGRPKEGPTEKYSLKHIVGAVAKELNTPIKFSDDCIGNDAFQKSSSLKAGEVLLLENLRFYKEEEKGDVAFAEKLSKHGNVFVNDAFGTAHRAHASTTIMAQFFDKAHTCFGFLMAGEVANLKKVMDHPAKPFVAIVGGAKVSDKIMIIEKLMDRADHIIIGGGMAFTFIKALGGNVGKSLCELDKLDVALSLISKAKEKGVHLHLPDDVVVADNFSNDAQLKTCDIAKIDEGWMGLDIGPVTIKNYSKIINESKTILWNGPMGVFEMSNFEAGTKGVADAIVNATSHGAYSLIGGGDSVAAINKYKLASKVSYVSTGGGALLEYIEQGSLPGVSAIEG